MQYNDINAVSHAKKLRYLYLPKFSLERKVSRKMMKVLSLLLLTQKDLVNSYAVEFRSVALYCM